MRTWSRSPASSTSPAAPDVEAALRRIEGATTRLTSIVVDLRGLTFIDSTDLRLLVEANRRAGATTYRLVLRRPPDRVCQIASVDALLPFQSAPARVDA
jgi:anti-anti-sigma factor